MQQAHPYGTLASVATQHAAAIHTVKSQCVVLDDHMQHDMASAVPTFWL